MTISPETGVATAGVEAAVGCAAGALVVAAAGAVVGLGAAVAAVDAVVDAAGGGVTAGFGVVVDAAGGGFVGAVGATGGVAVVGLHATTQSRAITAAMRHCAPDTTRRGLRSGSLVRPVCPNVART